MRGGYQVNRAKAELAECITRQLMPTNPDAAGEIVERIAALIAAGVGIQSHPGSPLTNQ